MAALPLSQRAFAILGFAGSAAVLSLVAWALHDATSQSARSAHWVGHTHEVLRAVSDVRQSVSRLDAAQRGYLISGDARFVDDREAAVADAREAALRVATLTADHPDQQARIAAIRGVIEQRIDEAVKNARLRETLVNGEPVGKLMTAAAQQRTAEILTLTRDMQLQEERLLALRRSEDRDRQRRERAVLILSALTTLALLVPAGWGLLRQIERRQSAERRLRELLDTIPVTVWQLRTAPDGKRALQFVGRSAQQLRGIAPDAALQDTAVIWDQIVEADRPRFMAAMDEAERDVAPFDCEYRISVAGGLPRWLLSRATLRREPDGSIIWNGYWADVTEQKQLVAALQHARVDADAANRAKSSFLATMSHEIRTPMNGVLGMLELLSLTRLDARQRASLGVVRESGRALLRIIDDVLDFSKVEAGRLELVPEVASIGRVMERVHAVFRGVAASKRLSFEWRVDPQIGPAHTFDPVRLGQILNNFVSNALKFTTKGSVLLSAALTERREGRETICFSVKDTGIGVSADAQRQLFQPFVQAEGDTTRHYGGTGLGLAICRRLATLMGGEVEMSSRPGEGTTLTLTLSFPVADAALLEQAHEQDEQGRLEAELLMRRVAPSIESAAEDGQLVLVVDDHPVNRLILVNQLNALGYAAETAESGEEALAQWRTGRFALVLTDCNMPGMSGYDLARTLRAAEAAEGRGRTPIIACTANALEGEAEACFGAGMDDFLTKPVNVAELLQRLSLWLPSPDSSHAPLDDVATLQGHAVAGSPLDRSVLAEIAGGDAAAQREILLDFRRVNDEDGLALRAAVSAADLPAVTRTAHRIKGASKMVGARELAHASRRIESASRRGDLDGVTTALAAFQAALQRLNSHLDTG
ncbi:MAG TPA: ATP-binding protein [Methylibium sp.]|nr:ATP-binding protein [Methylibium sp.]